MSKVALSRAESILLAKINGESYDAAPLSRMEELLIDLNAGGGGGEDVEALTRDVLTLKGAVGDLQNHAILDSDYPDK